MCRSVHNFHQLLKEGLAHKKHGENYWGRNKGSSKFTGDGRRSLVFQGLSLGVTHCFSDNLFKIQRPFQKRKAQRKRMEP